jgi:site-specific recombinase XerD
MKKISYRVVFNRKKKLNAQGKALLQVEAYLNKKKMYISTHIYLQPEQWDKNKEQVVKHPNAESLNYMIREFIITLEQKEIKAWKSGTEITLNLFKAKQSGKEDNSFLHFVKGHLETLKIKESTRKNRLSTLTLLKSYKSSITFKEMDSHLVYELEKHLYANQMGKNTVAKHMKHLKSFVHSAIVQGYINANDDAFLNYRIKTCEGKHSFLLSEELQKLEEVALEGRKASFTHTLDAFLFCCYTGLRYSDFVNLSEENVVHKNGKPWLMFTSVKTGTEVNLPLALLFEGKAWKLLQKYKNRWNDFFKLKANSHVNRILTRISQLAGVNKHFSFHSARHTNATLLIYKGASITTVQKLLGHRNISTTQIYSKVLESTIVKDLERCEKTEKHKKTGQDTARVENG